MHLLPNLEKPLLELLSRFERLFANGEDGGPMLIAISEAQALSSQLAVEIALLAGSSDIHQVTRQSRLLTAQSRLIKNISRAIVLTKRARVIAYEQALLKRRERLIS